MKKNFLPVVIAKIKDGKAKFDLGITGKPVTNLKVGGVLLKVGEGRLFKKIKNKDGSVTVIYN